MLLKGSCHCGAVKFEFQSHTPYPYQRCYCSICRKLNGGGGYTINIMGKHDTLKVDGEQHITVYRSKLNDRGAYEADGLGFSRRHFYSRRSHSRTSHGSQISCRQSMPSPAPGVGGSGQLRSDRSSG